MPDFGYWRWRIKNVWLWPIIFQVGVWWEKRYRPERWEGGAEGAIILPSGRSTTRRPDETLPEMVDRLDREDQQP